MIKYHLKHNIIKVGLNGGYGGDAGKSGNLKTITNLNQGKHINQFKIWNDNERRDEKSEDQLSLSISSVSVALPINSKYGMIT